MICRNCGEQTIVTDSRPCDGGIRRRRKCPMCLHRQTTREVMDADYEFMQRMTELQNRATAILSEIVAERSKHNADDTRG